MSREQLAIAVVLFATMAGSLISQIGKRDQSSSSASDGTSEMLASDGPAIGTSGHAVQLVQPSPSEPRAAEAPVLRLIRDFLDATPTAIHSGEQPKPIASQDAVATEIAELQSMAQLAHVRIDFLIATVPDPVESRVGWFFDSLMSAIAQAFSTLDFDRERYYYPWRDALIRNPRVPPRDWMVYRNEPGAILFRRPDLVTSAASNDAPPVTLVVVLLVGETPTQGIHKRALTTALNLVHAWDDAGQHLHVPSGGTGHPKSRLKLRILGPTFSGSALSLSIALRRWLNDIPPQPAIACQIISGSATDVRAKPLLDFESGAHGVTFHATVIPSQVTNYLVLEAFLHTQRKLDGHDVALLVESGTAYGGNLFPPTSPLSSAAPPSAFLKNVLVLPFPMHIAQLRSAHGRDPNLREGLFGAVSGPRFNLEPDLEAGGQSLDQMPTTSAMTPVTTERVLANILSAIGRRGIKYLGLVGTDPMDKLFLARQIKMYCPDVQLFIYESDLLTTHPSFARDLEGALVISTYPLFSRTQAWCYPFESSYEPMRRHQFSAHFVQGCYNAVLALCEPHLTPDVQPNGAVTNMIDYSPPFLLPCRASSMKPALWLSIVGNDGLWPITYFPYEEYNIIEERCVATAWHQLLGKGPPDSGKKYLYELGDTDSSKKALRLSFDAAKEWRRDLPSWSKSLNDYLDERIGRSGGPGAYAFHLTFSGRRSLWLVAALFTIFMDFCVLRYLFFNLRCQPLEAPPYRGLLHLSWTSPSAAAEASTKPTPTPRDQAPHLPSRKSLPQTSQSAAAEASTKPTPTPRDQAPHLPSRKSLPQTSQSAAAEASTKPTPTPRDQAPHQLSRKSLPPRRTQCILVVFFFLNLGTLFITLWSPLLPLAWYRGQWQFESGLSGYAQDVVLLLGLALVPLSLAGVLLALIHILGLVAVDFLSARSRLFRSLSEWYWIRYKNVVRRLDSRADAWLTRSLGKYDRFVRLLARGRARYAVSIMVSLLAVIIVADAMYESQVFRNVNIVLREWLQYHHGGVLYSERSAQLFNHVSPVLPLALLLLVPLIWILGWLHRLHILHRLNARDSLNAMEEMEDRGCERGEFDLAGIWTLIRDTDVALRSSIIKLRPLSRLEVWVITLGVCGAVLFVLNWNPALEDTWFDRAVFALSGLAVTLMLLNALQVLRGWYAFRAFLHRMSWHPLITAYARVPQKIKNVMHKQLFASLPTDAELESSVHKWMAIRELGWSIKESLEQRLPPEDAQELWKQLELAMRGSPEPDIECANVLTGPASAECAGSMKAWQLRKRCLSLAGALIPVLACFWKTGQRTGSSPGIVEWFDIAEDFVVLQTVTLVRFFTAQLQDLLRCSLLMALTYLLAVNAYPYQTKGLLLAFSWLACLFVVGVCIFIFMQCNRDETMLRFSSSEPYRFRWSGTFVMSVASFVLVPIGVAILLQFPLFSRHVQPWLETLARLVK